MKLIVDRLDLKPEHQDRNCSLIKFEHFTIGVQSAILAVGRAKFREFDGSSYNAVYPPSETADPVLSVIKALADAWFDYCQEVRPDVPVQEICNVVMLIEEK